MDPNISDTGYYPALQQDSDQIYYSSSSLELTGQTNDAELENSANQPGMEYAELLANQPGMEYTQLLVADADAGDSDESWPPSLTAEFIEQCVQALDAINDSSCLTVSNDQLSLLYPGVVSVEELNRVVSIDGFQGHVSQENLETEDISFPWPSIDGTHMTAPDSIADSEFTHLDPDSAQLDCSVQPVISVDQSGVSGLCQPLPSVPSLLPAPAAWLEQPWDSGAAPPQEQLVYRPASADDPASFVPLPAHRGLHGPVGMDEQAAWSSAPAAEADPRTADTVGGTAGWWRRPPPPPPSAAARLAEVECELTVSEETEQEVAPPGGGPAAIDLAPYQEHNYDYPLEPLVAGEVRPSADHQYASRPASPGNTACSSTDHRYAYSPPAALTEEDLIRSISDQLGLPQDHGYSQRQGSAPGQTSLPPPPVPAPPVQTLPPIGPGLGSEMGEPRGAELCLVMESCPPDWEPTLDEPAGNWVDPNMVMGLTAGWQREEEVGDDGDVAPAAEQLFDGADAVLLDEELWESGVAVLDEASSKYVVLDVVEPNSLELNGTLNVALQDTGGNEQDFVLAEDVQTVALGEDAHTLAAAGALDNAVGSELVLPEADTDLTQLLWTVAGSSLVPSEAETASTELGLAATLPDSRSMLSDCVPALTAENLSASADSLSAAAEASVTLAYSAPAEMQVSPTLPDPPPEEPAICAALVPDTPSLDVMASSSLPCSLPAELEESPLTDTLPAPAGPELPATIPDISPATKPEPPHETNIVICRPATGTGSVSPPPPPPPSSPPLPPLPPAQLPVADPAEMVRGWLLRRATSQQPVTRAQMSGDLATLLGPERRRRLSDSGVFLAQWLDRLTTEGGTEKAAGGKQARLSYPPEFKLLMLSFTDFMPPDQLAAAFCVPLTLFYKWRAKVEELTELAKLDSGYVRAKGAGKKRRSNEADAEFDRWQEQREKESDAPPSYAEVRLMAKQLHRRSGLKVRRFRLFQREHSVSNRRRDHTAIQWLLTEFELGRATDRAALVAYGLQPGGLDWAKRLLARYAALCRPFCTWQMVVPPPLLAAAEQWAGTLEPPPPHAVTVMADVPIMTKPAPCAVWKSEDSEESEHLATLLISCTLEGSVLPPMLILKGGGRRVYSDSCSGLLTAQQEAGRLDAARAGLWLQLVGCRGPARLLLLNSYCAPRPDQLHDQAAGAGCRLALVPPGLAAIANPLMASRQRLMMSIAAALGDGEADMDLLTAVRAQLAGWGDSPQLKQDLARVERLYSVPSIPAG